MNMALFQTPGLHGYSLKFSPFASNRLACVLCQNYGISGIFYLVYMLFV